MKGASMLVPLVLALCAAMASAAVVEHNFTVGGMNISQLCMDSVIYTANEQMPGPTIEATEGDTVAVHVVNDSPYPLSLHWHGIFQLLSGWADGAHMITECPIQPSGNFTYRFNITGQEGTLWWHAHSSLLRATIYGALIIKPRNGTGGYPYTAPYGEIPIILGEWWNKNVDDVEKDAHLTGLGPDVSDALTINGKPGDLTSCRGAGIYEVEVEYNQTYLLRIINAAVNVELFFKVSGHNFTVVAIDASYTEPYATDVIVIAPGQTVDALMTTSATPGGRYYMAANVFESKTVQIRFNNGTVTGIITYKGAANGTAPSMPAMPAPTDVVTAGNFYWSLRGLVRPIDPPLPTTVDHQMLVEFGVDQAPCAPDQTRCQGFALVAFMNRNSFQFPKNASLLQASFDGVPGVYTEDFPSSPPLLPGIRKATSVKRVNHSDVVEVVLQSQAYSSALGTENHPIHLHGFNFFVLAQGLGRFDLNATYNLVNPRVRNTVIVPGGGWTVIRFVANNPGMWFMHCHLDAHLPLGLAMVFEVLNGPAPNILPPPPEDFPKCY
ncbi:laccase-8-like [Triticum dicoccoides]|uniref:laccase-8-like n=1 Tax=Triticum dicoccoides TaxID=85692 RepID=UPI00188E3A98|nr:laccase-8-like [Triticum dicoccoides]